MKLSDLKTGERGVIVKVMGHGGFRKRIVEMGFIKGKVVDVLQNAPLQDPVKYKIMGYEVSLRRSEAEMIEIISTEEAARIEKNTTPQASIPAENNLMLPLTSAISNPNISALTETPTFLYCIPVPAGSSNHLKAVSPDNREVSLHSVPAPDILSHFGSS